MQPPRCRLQQCGIHSERRGGQAGARAGVASRMARPRACREWPPGGCWQAECPACGSCCSSFWPPRHSEGKAHLWWEPYTPGLAGSRPHFQPVNGAEKPKIAACVAVAVKACQAPSARQPQQRCGRRRRAAVRGPSLAGQPVTLAALRPPPLLCRCRMCCWWSTSGPGHTAWRAAARQRLRSTAAPAAAAGAAVAAGQPLTSTRSLLSLTGTMVSQASGWQASAAGWQQLEVALCPPRR